MKTERIGKMVAAAEETRINRHMKSTNIPVREPLRSVLTVFLALWMSVTPAETPEDDSLISAELTFASDYVFRGISQTMGDPAVQAGLDFVHPSGFFAGIWASNVDFMPADEPDDDADLETDYFIGYWHEFNEHWSAEASLVRYAYPGTAPGVQYDYNEILLGVKFHWLSAMIAYSNDAFAQKKDGVAYELSGEYPFKNGINLAASYGYYDLSDVYENSYFFYEVGLSRALGPVTLGVTYHNTDKNAQKLFGDQIAGSRTVMTLSAGF